MERLQVKFCKGEKELNEFLMTLNIGHVGYPQLQSINYVAEIQGKGSDVEINMGSSVIAAVQYFVEVE
jgi:hypothetical protein